MDLHVLAAMMFAAFCHAAWNASIKVRLDPAVATVLMSVASGVVAMPLLVLFGLPAAESWPFLAASLVIHIGYWTALSEAYRFGDFGQVYPLARGGAPLFTALGSMAILSESLGPVGWAGILTLVAGVLLLSLGKSSVGHIDRRAVALAFATALTIVAYTLVDGIGARRSGSPHAYALAFFAGNGLVMLAFGLLRAPRRTVMGLKKDWTLAFVGGVLSLASYWIALWAMTRAPIGLVAAVRETSVLFAAILSITVLKEKALASRVVAAGLVMAGLILVRLH